MRQATCAYFLLGIIVASSAAAQKTQAPKKLTPQQLYAKTIDSVVMIECEVKDGTVEGTGFFYRSPFSVVTCYHVIEGAKSIIIKGTRGAKWIPSTVFFDKAADVAILTLPSSSGRTAINQKPFAKVQTGEDVVVLGSPLGLSGSLTRGIVSAKRLPEKTVPLIQIDAAISHGSSGSPILSSSGEVMGVVSFSFSEGQLLNMGVSIDAVNGISARSGVSVFSFVSRNSLANAPNVAGNSVDSEKSTSSAEPKTLERIAAENKDRVNAQAGKYLSKIILATLKMRVDLHRAMEAKSSRYTDLSFSDLLKVINENVDLGTLNVIYELSAKLPASQFLADLTDMRNDLRSIALDLKTSMDTYVLDLQFPSLVSRSEYDRHWNEVQSQADRMAEKFTALAKYFLKCPWYDSEKLYAAISSPAVAYFAKVALGFPDPDLPEIAKVSVATKLNGEYIKKGDKIVGIRLPTDAEFREVNDWRDIVNFYLDHKNDSDCVVRIIRDGDTITTIAKMRQS